MNSPTPDLLDLALHSRWDAKTQPNSKTWRASSAGYCARGSYYERLGVPKTRVTPAKEIRTLEWGNAIHDFVKGLLRETGCLIEPEKPQEICPGCRPDEWHLEDTDLNASAHLDALLTSDPAFVTDGDTRLARLRYEVFKAHGTDATVRVCEIKGQKSSAMTRAVREMKQGKHGAPEHHMLQLGMQALIIRRNPHLLPVQPDAFELLHVGKDAWGSLTWPLTDAWVKRAEDWLGSLNQAWAAGVVPPCTCTGWKQTYCAWPDGNGGCCADVLEAA